MDLGSSAAQYFGDRPDGTSVLRFEHAKQRLRRGNVGHIKDGIAVEQDPLEPLGIDNVERQIMVGNQSRRSIRRPLLLNLPRSLLTRNWS